MPWTEISTGHFQQAVAIEETSRHALEYGEWCITAHTTAVPYNEVHEFVQRFRSAWQKLRFQHPVIAAVAHQRSINYTISSQEAVEQWTTRTLFVGRSSILDHHAATATPAPLATLQILPDTGEVRLRTIHWHVQLPEVLELVEALLELAGSGQLQNTDEIAWGEEVARLDPFMRLASSASQGLSEGTTRAVGCEFSESATTAINQYCSSRQTNVASALRASLATINWAFPGRSNSPSATHQSQQVDSDGPGVNDELQEIYKQYSRDLGDLLNNTPPNVPSSSEIDIVDLGDIDEVLKPSHKALEVFGIRIAIGTTTRRMRCLASTFRGKLSLSLCYNEAYFTSDAVAALLEKLKSNLLRDLEVWCSS